LNFVYLIYISAQNFIKFWCCFTALWRYNDSEDGGHPCCRTETAECLPTIARLSAMAVLRVMVIQNNRKW